MSQKATMFELKLKYPILSASGVEINTLSVRRGTRGDMKAAARYSKDQVEQESFLFAKLTGLTVEDIDALDLEDATQLVEMFRSALSPTNAG